MLAQQKPVSFITILFAILLAGGMALYALYLLIVGLPSTIVYETPGPTEIVYMPYPTASLPLVALAFIITGLVTQRMLMAWLGWAGLCVFSLLFVFSLGGALLPFTGLLLLLLIVISLVRRK